MHRIDSTEELGLQPQIAGHPDLLVCLTGRKTLHRAADGPVLVGREPPEPGIRVDHPGVSRLHLWLHPGPRWIMVDYESRNGTYIDGRRIPHEAVITDGLTAHLAAAAGVPITFHYGRACNCADTRAWARRPPAANLMTTPCCGTRAVICAT